MTSLFRIVLAVLVGAVYFVIRGEAEEPIGGLPLFELPAGIVTAVTAALSVAPMLIGVWTVKRLRAMVEARLADAAPPPEGPRGLFRFLLRRLRTAPIIIFVFQVFVLGWPELVLGLGIKGWVLVDKLLLLLPFLVALLLSWIPEYQLERLRTGRRSTLTLSGYLLYQARLTTLPCIPILVFFLIIDVVELIEPLRSRIATQSYLIWIAVLLFVGLMFLFFPVILIRSWGAKPLPDGPLRARLEEFSRVNRFRCREILLWNTGGRLINAAILGLTGRFRYVVLTDGLLASLREDELLAVFAHEVGHAKHRHVTLYFLFSVSYVCFLYVIQQWLMSDYEELLEEHPLVLLSVVLVLFGLYWGILFGYLSRRFELEADVFALESLGHSPLLIGALERISSLSGRGRTLPSWRHFSVANRVEFLARYQSDSALRSRFRWKIRGLVTIMLVVLLLGMMFAYQDLRREHYYSLVRMAIAEDDCERALEMIDLALGSDVHPRLTIEKAEILLMLGRKEEASDLLDHVRSSMALQDSDRERLDALERRILEVD